MAKLELQIGGDRDRFALPLRSPMPLIVPCT